jgi:hypothetical protein
MAKAVRPVPSNIYTILLFIALVALIAGVGYTWYRSSQITGTANPFAPPAAAMPAAPAPLLP